MATPPAARSAKQEAPSTRGSTAARPSTDAPRSRAARSTAAGGLRPGQERLLLAGCIAIGCAPIVISVLWAIAGEHWFAGDRSVMGVFTHDVFSKDTPLLGTVSTMGNYSGSEGAGSVHHLGPAQFWVLAIPNWITREHPVGLLMGALIVNCASVALVATFVRRRLGVVAATAATLMCTVLAYGLGPSLLRDIWTPFLGLWPVLALVVLVWSLIDGDPRALPWAALVSGFLAQIELMFVGPAAVLSVAGVVGFVLRRRGDRRRAAEAAEVAGAQAATVEAASVETASVEAASVEAASPETASVEATSVGADGDGLEAAIGSASGGEGGDKVDEVDAALDQHRPDPGGSLGSVGTASAGGAAGAAATVAGPAPMGFNLVIAEVVAVLMWWPVLYDELTGDPGNLTLLVRALRHGTEKAGFAFVWHNLIAQVTLPPVWMQRATSPFDIGQEPSAFELISAVAFVAALVGVTRVAWRRRRVAPTVWALVVTCYPVLLAGFVNLSITPEAGAIGLQYRRWLWPFGAYLWLAVLVGGASWVSERGWVPALRERARGFTAGVATLGLAAVVVIPASIGQLTPPSNDVVDNAVVESMYEPLHDALPEKTTYLSFGGANAAFGVGPEIMRRLLVDGYTMRTSTFGADSFGEQRVLTKDRMADQTLELISGVSLAPPGVPMQVLAAGRRDRSDASDYVKLANQVLHRVRGGPGFTLTPTGLRYLHETLAKESPRPIEKTLDLLAHPERAIFDSTLMRLQVDGEVTSSPITDDEARALLQGQHDVAVMAYLDPAPEPPDES